MVTIDNASTDLVSKLINLGFKRIETKTKYEMVRLVSLNPKVTAILYNSKKLLIQTSSENEDIILEKLGIKNKNKNQNQKKISGLIVGSDETLKGDTFGGLVVAGVLCDDEKREELRRIGVDDSKKINDDAIKILAKRIKEILPPMNISVKNIYPEEYNNNSQTDLMNKLHRGVYTELSKNNPVHIVDKYPGCTVGDIIETKAESKYVEVAAASIIARDEGLNQLKELSSKLGYVVPKGSTHVKHALEYLKQSNKYPKYFVKLHFKNVQKIISL